MISSDSIRKRILDASGEAVVKATQRSIRIVDIILRHNGLPSIYVAKYSDSYVNDQYFFYQNELTFPALHARSLATQSTWG